MYFVLFSQSFASRFSLRSLVKGQNLEYHGVSLPFHTGLSLKYHIILISLCFFISISLVQCHLNSKHHIISVSSCFFTFTSLVQGRLKVSCYLSFSFFSTLNSLLQGHLKVTRLSLPLSECHITLGSLAQSQTPEQREI